MHVFKLALSVSKGFLFFFQMGLQEIMLAYNAVCLNDIKRDFVTY